MCQKAKAIQRIVKVPRVVVKTSIGRLILRNGTWSHPTWTPPLHARLSSVFFLAAVACHHLLQRSPARKIKSPSTPPARSSTSWCSPWSPYPRPYFVITVSKHSVINKHQQVSTSIQPSSTILNPITNQREKTTHQKTKPTKLTNPITNPITNPKKAIKRTVVLWSRSRLRATEVGHLDPHDGEVRDVEVDEHGGLGAGVPATRIMGI